MRSWLLALTPALTIWGVNQQSECSLACSLIPASQIKFFKKRVIHFGAFCTLAFQIRDAHLVYVFVLHDFFSHHKEMERGLEWCGEGRECLGSPRWVGNAARPGSQDPDTRPRAFRCRAISTVGFSSPRLIQYSPPTIITLEKIAAISLLRDFVS